jgi:hypothetical protein
MASSKRYGFRLRFSRDKDLIEWLDTLTKEDECSEWVRDAIREKYDREHGLAPQEPTPVSRPTRPVSVPVTQEVQPVPIIQEEIHERPTVREETAAADDDIESRLDRFGDNF